jgi:hypothetical protein
MAPRNSRSDIFAAPSGGRPGGGKNAGQSAQSQGLAEARLAADRVRERTAKLRAKRLERDAAAEPEPAATPRKSRKSPLNLARTQRGK